MIQMTNKVITIVYGKLLSFNLSSSKVFDERIPCEKFTQIHLLIQSNQQFIKHPVKTIRKYYSTDSVRIVEKGGILVDQYKIVKQNISYKIISDETNTNQTNTNTIFDKYILFEERQKREIDTNIKERDLILEQHIESYSFKDDPNIRMDFIHENNYFKIQVVLVSYDKNDTYLKCVTMIEKIFM